MLTLFFDLAFGAIHFLFVSFVLFFLVLFITRRI
jgi:hypothetical protein